MAKRKKKQLQLEQLSPWGRFWAKFRRFDVAALLLALVIVLATAAAAGQSYDLGQADATGFLVWFLLFIGYIPLELFGLFAWLFGVEPETVSALLHGREIVVLGGCNLVMVAVIWAVMRFWVRRRFGAEPLRVTTIFLRILFFWGVVQLLCFGAMKIWDGGKLNPLHRHLRSSCPLRK